ncbi:winged helix-turn-helix transcriptional regulator [Mucilaginibacter terrae]|uniref:DNA-binding HxlR family transcriptional regulator n=1 Tax=Mucilaginibacter terrae TaxID=1955052 RepID=A0ABU3GV88_9SPHI|nr:helix-turn-helix domain-containing protein [Mucilaginibacter terrae]MDT3403386.1 DNA-binding HxlR family transcriptional regulator [Mucilaginibacter terrae]
MAKLPDQEHNHSPEACKASVDAVRDALYAVNGKWKFPLMMALSNGPQRFKDIQRALGDITPKILSKELKELELNEFVKRNVFATKPVTVTYELTPYSRTLDSVLHELGTWGREHREHIKRSMKAKPVEEVDLIEKS